MRRKFTHQKNLRLSWRCFPKNPNHDYSEGEQWGRDEIYPDTCKNHIYIYLGYILTAGGYHHGTISRYIHNIHNRLITMVSKIDSLWIFHSCGMWMGSTLAEPHWPRASPNCSMTLLRLKRLEVSAMPALRTMDGSEPCDVVPKVVNLGSFATNGDLMQSNGKNGI